MDLAHIPKKTDKGRVEVQTRAYQVGPRERSVLIMVDGKTPARLLLAKLAFMKKADEILDELCVGGFIDISGSEDHAAQRQTPVAPMTPLTEELRARRQFACDFVRLALGPSADYLALRLQGCQSRETLLPLLEECRDYIEMNSGAQTAQAFWNELGQMAISQTSARRLVA
ncbi:MAG: hypothetical protein HZC22_13880 [Rhodocyclales bacterium]|nr:hypothetical protein [Rhodocyclales bacterium]